MVGQLRDQIPAAVILEATAGIELPLAAALAAASLPVVVVNPRRVRDFAKATGKLAKTDALDAQVLAHCVEAVRPPVRPQRGPDTQDSTRCPPGVTKPIPRWDVHFGEIDDDSKHSTAPHITFRPQLGGHQ